MIDDIDAMVYLVHDKRKLNTFKEQTLLPSDKLENFQQIYLKLKKPTKL